jgi:feruloyl-CoA hydratase/lyase
LAFAYTEEIVTVKKEKAPGVVRVEFEKGVAWVTFNRPEKRNAMNPALNSRMIEVLDQLEGDDRCGVMVLTGEGEAFSAGMDLKEYFREMDDQPRAVRERARRTAYEWQWRRLTYFGKPTIAMVNGWCFGGAFTPMICCDLAIAADEAQFGLSEVNWGIIPAGNVSRAVALAMRHRDALFYLMTGLSFDGKKAAAMGLVNESIPRARLRKRVREIADILLEKNPNVLRIAKDAFKRCRDLPWEMSEDYLTSKQEQLWLIDGQARKDGMKQFLDDKTYRPGLGAYRYTGEKSSK